MQKKAHALVVLPWSPAGMSPQHRRWLARSRWLRSAPGEMLLQVLPVLGVTRAPQGLGALRLWGQTGQRPAGWVAAADPVCFEARLDHLVLHPLHGLPEGEVSEMFVYLQQSLAAEDSVELTSIGTLGYLRRGQPMATASASPMLAQGSSPEAFLPSGVEATAHDRLQGEIQMCLYEADINRRRERAGMPPVNALWLWGGGAAPQVRMQTSGMTLPALFADDPLFKGYWLSVAVPVAPRPGDLDACLQASPRGFVAVLPDTGSADATAEIDLHLSVLRRMLQRGRLSAMTLLFAGGSRAHRRRWDALRLWRRNAALPTESVSR
jgi:hypothetical protein